MSKIQSSNNTGREIAQGSYATVFEHLTDIDKVVKIVQPDDASLSWYGICMEENKSYMPKIYSIEMNENHQVEIVMERLDMTFKIAFQKMPLLINFLQYVQCEIENVNPGDYMKGVIKQYELTDIMKEVHKFLHPLFRKFHSDIHPGNLMLRHRGEGNYEWVITDPIF